MKLLRAPLIALALATVGLATILAFNSHWVRISTVQIDLASNSKEDLLFQRIRAALTKQMSAFEGRYFWEVPLREVHEITQRDRRVKSVSIYREFPSKLRVVIEPHTPVLAFLSLDGRVYPMATDATLLPALPITESPDLPIVRGEDLKDEPTLREKILELIATVPNEGTINRAAISEIVYSKKEGFKLFVTGGRAEIRLGDSDFGPKLSRVERVLTYLDSRDIKGRVIDARFSKKVVVRVRNTP